MQRLTPNSALSPANRLEELADQVGGTYHLNTLVARVEKPHTVLMVTLVNHGSPGSVQDWAMLNGSESVVGSVVVAGMVTIGFETEGGEFSAESVESYVLYLLENAEWFGAAAPYNDE